MERMLLYFIHTFILAVLLISCTSKQMKPEKGIVGKWEFVKSEPDVETSDSTLTAKLSAEMFGDRMGKDLDGNPMKLIFSDNGILTINGNPATYAIVDGKLRVVIEGNDMLNDFRLKGDSLELHINMKEIIGSSIKENEKIKRLGMIQYFVRK